jgi:outer membrane protein, heavy metal efflux system
VPPSADQSFSGAQKLLSDHSSHTIQWNRKSPEDAAVCQDVRAMLQKPLSAEDAVQIALLNNRSLQATYEDLGIAQADLVQAGLLTNPKFFADIRVPNRGPGSPDAEFSLAADFLELLLVPLRKQMAADQLAVAQRRVADAVLNAEHETRVAFYTYQSRRQSLALQRTIAEAQSASLELARRAHQVGNISDLDLASEESTYSSARLEVARTEAQARADRETLNRLMGLWGVDSAAWQAAEKLPDLPEAETPTEHLESLAISQRLDLDIARRQTHIIAQSLGLAEQFRLTGIQVGFDIERRDATENYVTVAGPQLSVDLPIFDQKQAQIARLQAQYRQNIDRLTALSIDIRAEVRSARDRLLAAREIARYDRDVIIPQRREVSRLSELHYNVMVLGVDRWLVAREQEVSAYKDYIEAVREYWIARSDLERAVGGRLVSAEGNKP